MDERVSLLFGEVQASNTAGKEKEHYPVKKPALAYVLHHSPKGVRQGGRQENDR
jgi:hypothetical protein